MFIPQLQALPLLALYYDSDLFSVRADVFCGTVLNLEYIFLRSHYNCRWQWHWEMRLICALSASFEWEIMEFAMPAC